MMLNERPASGLSYDARTDIATVAIAQGAPTTFRTRQIEGALLLDAQGFLVGLDLRDDQGRGVVVMLGPHEAVDGTQAHPLALHTDAAGEVTAVTFSGAKNAIRAAEKNPYR